jgi:hypothetical protein
VCCTANPAVPLVAPDWLVCLSSTDVARQSIALVRDTSGLLPLRTKNVAVRAWSEDPIVFAEEGNIDTADAIILLLGIRPRSGKGNLNVPEEAKRIAEKHAKKTIAVSLGSPYIIRELGDVSTFIAAWGVQPVLQHAAMEAVRGEFEMTGRMPVTL